MLRPLACQTLLSRCSEHARLAHRHTWSHLPAAELTAACTTAGMHTQTVSEPILQVMSCLSYIPTLQWWKSTLVVEGTLCVLCVRNLFSCLTSLFAPPLPHHMHVGSPCSLTNLFYWVDPLLYLTPNPLHPSPQFGSSSSMRSCPFNNRRAYCD